MGDAIKPLTLKDFFLLRPAGSSPRGIYWLTTDGTDSLDRPFRSYLRGVSIPRKPLAFTVQFGAKTADILGNSLMQLIVSDRLKQALKRSKLSGWKPFPTTIRSQTGQIVPGKYFGISFTGKAVPLDWNRSVSDSYDRGDGTRQIMKMRCISFNTKRWDGSDFFLLKEADYFIVTQKVITLLTEEQFEGWKATPILKYKF